MKADETNNKRIAKNTALLYVRMILVMAVGLFTSRIILESLGVNDFGIYSVVGGIVTLFSIISASLSSAISRFLTYELGRQDEKRLREVFSTSLSIQLFISAIVVLLCGTIGFWFLNNKMDIDPSRLISANWVLVFSLLTFVVNLISVPYNAAIIAHERMSAFAYVSIVEVALKLGVAYMLFMFNNDRLILYAFLNFIVAVIIRLIYGIYCNRHFLECHARPHYHKSIFKEMSGFAGWNFIGSSSSIIRDQGNNVILNLFFGTAVNAAYGIGLQVCNAVYSFSQNFMTAINPQIIKTYAQRDFDALYRLIYSGSRYSFFLLWIISLVVLCNTGFLLRIWLKDVPEYTVAFVQLFIIFILCESISQPMITAQLATGNIRTYQIVVGGLKLFNLPTSYLFLRLGYPPYVVEVVAIIISIGMFGLRLLFLRNMIHLKVRKFFSKVILRIIFVVLTSVALSYVVVHYTPNSYVLSFVRCVIILFISSICVFTIGCTPGERKIVLNRIKVLPNLICTQRS